LDEPVACTTPPALSAARDHGARANDDIANGTDFAAAPATALVEPAAPAAAACQVAALNVEAAVEAVARPVVKQPASVTAAASVEAPPGKQAAEQTRPAVIPAAAAKASRTEPAAVEDVTRVGFVATGSELVAHIPSTAETIMADLSRVAVESGGTAPAPAVSRPSTTPAAQSQVCAGHSATADRVFIAGSQDTKEPAASTTMVAPGVPASETLGAVAASRLSRAAKYAGLGVAAFLCALLLQYHTASFLRPP
jgi:hypothetical protein